MARKLATSIRSCSWPEGACTPKRDFAVIPEQIKRLGTGEAIVIGLCSKRPAQPVWVSGLEGSC